MKIKVLSLQTSRSQPITLVSHQKSILDLLHQKAKAVCSLVELMVTWSFVRIFFVSA